MRAHTLPSLTLIAGLLLGCSGGDDAPPEAMTLRDRLQTELSVNLENDPDGVTVHSVVDLGTTQNELDVLFGVSGGTMSLHTDAAGQILLTEVDADLSDIAISPTAFPPDGLTITDIHAMLEDPVVGPGDWSIDDQRVIAAVTGNLLVDWAVVQDTGEALPLVQQRVEGVEFAIDAQQDDIGAITVAVVATRAGDFFTWSDLVTLSELSVLLHGTLPVR